MSPDELKKKLEALGVKVGEWTEVEGKEVKARHPLLADQVDNLKPLKTLLETQIAKDKDQLEKARELLILAKHGGHRG